METTLNRPQRVRRQRLDPDEMPVVGPLALVDVERLTGLKIVGLEDRKNTIVAILANGVRFHIDR